MVKLLTPDAEDIRRLGRERKTLIAERVFHVNRIKGCSLRKEYESTSPCVVIAVSAWMSFEPEMAGC